MRQTIACLTCALLWASMAPAQDLRTEAARAWERADQAEAALRALPPEGRTRNEHIRIVRLYEQVYLTTPHSGYSDDALIRIATLYEEMGAPGDAARTLRFLVSDYPASKHVPDARNRIARLNGETVAAAEDGTEAASRAPAPAPTPSPIPTASPASRGSVAIEGLRYWESAEALRVVVDLDGQPSFTRGEVEAPPRVYIDVRNARLGPGLDLREIAVDSPVLRGIRLGQYDTETVRIVLDLEGRSAVATFTLTDPYRLVIDVPLERVSTPNLASQEPPEVPPAAAPGLPLPTATALSDPAPDRAASGSLGTPAVPTENGEHTLSRSLGLKARRVVIDPGHGGFDPGTIGPSGLSEAELVLDVARRLEQRIRTDLPNTEVILSRTDDTFVPLEARPALANQVEADLFISIHANSSRTRSIRGFETYFLNLNPSPEAMEIAARENATSERALSDLQDIVSQIMMQEWVDESREFAGHIQKALASGDDFGRDRGVKQAPLVVLLGANMPSILAEISFISNPDDERLLKGGERRQQIADALFEGVRSYFGTLSGYRTAEAR
jgi:N-acetylmuramoyl-L-alanine amidase